MTGASGYFGKLPDRADFVVGNCPDGFLKIWEPFLMKGLAGSRLDLGSRWEETYMTMPVWRFWLVPGQDDGGLAQAVGGAVMPSVDRVGRKFPLTIAAAAKSTRGHERPSDDWFEEVETVLLGALDADQTLQGFQRSVTGLSEMNASDKHGQTSETGMLQASPETEDKLTSAFWCRAGRETFEFGCHGLPEASEFRWLMLPEAYEAEATGKNSAGQEHGRYHPEDHRT